ncbi:uncharacterized protein LOC133173658 [Saccostrea echinata]|uniref:uncharacterized protein LOC133173658 n=1 Tax=Saccostrea echinata TaxID=191078 RepID=UPI002A817317|nr:uncharacterized protein LOC133173658 [Saccostrea echinata]
MEFTNIYQISPLTFLLKANLVICTVMSQCGFNEFRRQFGNSMGYQCVPCRECPNGFREMSLCSNVTDTECEQCPSGTFYRMTRLEKLCQKCRQCSVNSDQLECMNDTNINCSSFCQDVRTLRTCKTCSTCRKNQFTKISCSATENTVCKTCKQCKGHHFIARKCSKSRNTHCKRCRKCIKGKTYLYKKCRGHRDTHCKSCSTCPLGYYVKRKCTRRHDTICAPCSADNINDVMCNKCPQGTYYERSSTNQSVCVSCAQGTFMDINNHNIGFCKRCRRCGPNEETIQACNATHDSECGDCSKGFFRLRSSHSCVMCSNCLKNLFNSSSLEVDECRRQMNDTDKVCMPSIPSVLLVVNASLLYRLGFNQGENPVYNETIDVNGTTLLPTRNYTTTPLPNRHHTTTPLPNRNNTTVPKQDGDRRLTSSRVVQTTAADIKQYNIKNHTETRIKSYIALSEYNNTITSLLTRSKETPTAVESSSVDAGTISIHGVSTYSPIVVGFMLILIIVLIILRLFMFKRKRSFSLKKQEIRYTVSKPTLFSTNSITDCFDLGIQYHRTSQKYSSDPDFKRHSEPLCRNDRGSYILDYKSRSLGTINAAELEFWNDRSLPRSTTRYNA